MGNPTENFQTLIGSYIQNAKREQQSAIEAMCWRSLDPETNPHNYGVLVEDEPMTSTTDAEKMTFSIKSNISLSPDVPFGEIHYKRGWL